MDKKGFDTYFIADLKQRCDIVSVLSKYIRLDKKGKNFWACCPFHHEKTPSFSVNDSEQYYHCFGCKESGDVITFVMKYENLGYLEAVKILAESVGMQLPTSADSEKILKQKQQEQKIKDILEAAAKFYQENLHDPKNVEARDYVIKRKLNKQSVQGFRIGYSKDWTSLVEHLKKLGYTIDDMRLAGVAEQKNNRAYDVFGGRLIFPITNAKSEVIGFSARALQKTDYAKYKNTAQTLVFNKSKAIFAIDKVKTQKQQGTLEYIVLVEGQIDVISLHQFGISGAVATLGTALTADHVPELKRYTNKIVVCFDGDSAGQKATLRALDILKDFDIKVVNLPQGADPDEYIREYGKQAFEQLVKQADDATEYKIKYLAQSIGLDSNDKKSKFVKSCLDILNKFESTSQKHVYLNLISKFSGVPVTVLTRDLTQGVAVPTQQKEVVEVTQKSAEDNIQKALKFVFASLAHKKDYAKLSFPRKVLINPTYEKLYDLFKQNRDNWPQPTELHTYFEDENNSIINDIKDYNFDVIGNNAIQYYNDCVWTFCENYLKEKQFVLNGQYHNQDFRDQRNAIAKELQKISLQLKNKNLEED